MNREDRRGAGPSAGSLAPKARLLTLALCTAFAIPLHADVRLSVSTSGGLWIRGVETARGVTPPLAADLPLFTLLVGDTILNSRSAVVRGAEDTTLFSFACGLEGLLTIDSAFDRGWRATVTLRNASRGDLSVANFVPFGQAEDRAYITAMGPPSLSRSALVRPGCGPIGVILPDNAWEMGFCTASLRDGSALTAIARRTGSGNADLRRFATVLKPFGWVQYTITADVHNGDFHEGLRLMFQKRWLFDLDLFDTSLGERKDLEWIRRSYLLTLFFAWDRDYYDRFKGTSGFEKLLTGRKTLFGHFDGVLLWPTWPRLGLDERNQWDLYRDLPGGLEGLRSQVDAAHRMGTRFFIAYNPWDQSTRTEEHLSGMEDMLRATGADGVCLDTWGRSTAEIQAAADRVRPGIVMYSEGMAVPRDMPGIVAGRVHDALYLPPPLNLNKLINPEFAIFRVLQLSEGLLHREVAIALFNGYGVELNVMRSGRPDWVEGEYRYLGAAVKLLRENSSAFLSKDWEPLIPARVDSVWINRWPGTGKTIYTVYGVRPEGYSGPLFEVADTSGRHGVSLWHHEERVPIAIDGRLFLPATVDGFSRTWLGTRHEGNAECIAVFPRLLHVAYAGDTLECSAGQGSSIVVTAGMPTYDALHTVLAPGTHRLSMSRTFGAYEGKVVVQLFDSTELLDERVVTIPPADPRLVSSPTLTPRAHVAPPDMVEIPAADFEYSAVLPEDANPVVPYPDLSAVHREFLHRYFMDVFPVTNEQFARFLKGTGYRPADTVNFLRHWKDGLIPKGLESHPVVWVSLEDARAFARWAGKRLPTAVEWQYAAQGTDGRRYPWGDRFDSTRCNYRLNRTSPVRAFPAGGSPFGVQDLVGNVWQMTNDIYFNGSYYYQIIRGGSFYAPASSIWYLKSGPVPVNQQQMLLMVSPGFDRSSTVGFRCVKDAR